MEPLDKADRFMDDLLDFASDIGDDDDKPTKPLSPSSSSFNRKRPDPDSFNFLCPDDPARSFPDFVEEELEWLSNKDAFPAIESFVGIIPDHPSSVLKQQSPVSVLENSTSSSNNSNNSTNTTGSIIMSCCGSLKVPVRARSKHRRKRRRGGFPDLPIQQSCWSQTNNKVAKSETNIIGRKCQHCGAEKTPQWRAGPQGPKTLCNACGVRYKSGRLVTEYRPASSPSFSSKLHSNSHRKIMEMRKQKMAGVVIKNMDKG